MTKGKEIAHDVRGSSEEPSDRERPDAMRSLSEDRRAQERERHREYRQTPGGKSKSKEYRKTDKYKQAHKDGNAKRKERAKETRHKVAEYNGRLDEYQQEQGTTIQETVSGVNNNLYHGGGQYDWKGFVTDGQQEYGGQAGVLYIDQRGQRPAGYNSMDQHQGSLAYHQGEQLDGREQLPPHEEYRFYQTWGEAYGTPETSSTDSGTGY